MLDDFVQTYAVIKPCSLGGPLVNIFFFFFNNPPPPEISPFPLPAALPTPPGELVDTSLWAGLEHVRPTMRFRRIFRASGTSRRSIARQSAKRWRISRSRRGISWRPIRAVRSEEHTSELQSRLHLVCRLLLE